MNSSNEVGIEYEDEVEFEPGEEEYTDEEEEEMEGEMEGGEEMDGDEEEEIANPNAQYIQGLGPLPGHNRPSAGASAGWEGLSKMSGATQRFYHSLLEELRKLGKDSLTILVLGKEGTGKTALVNALVNENTHMPEGFGQRRLPRPRLTSRQAAGFTLNVIDCPGLSEGDSGCDVILQGVVEGLEGRTVDVVLLVDRLDVYRVDDVDQQIWASITRVLGARVWQHTILALSHGRMKALPPDTSYDDYVQQRSSAVRSGIRRAGRCKKAALPLAVVESGSKCDTGSDGVKTLPNGTQWVKVLLEQIVEVSRRGAWSPSGSKPDNSDRRHLLWIPVVLAAQVAFKVFVLDPLLDRDREEWGRLGNPCINLAADAQKKAEWERKDAAPKKSRRIHEGARMARQ